MNRLPYALTAHVHTEDNNILDKSSVELTPIQICIAFW